MSTYSFTPLAEQLDHVHAALAEQVPAALLGAFDGQAQALAGRAFAAAAPQAGQPAPDFALNDSTGAPVTLGELLAGGPVVLAFYRGAWCPYCNAQLRAYQAALAAFATRGARLVAISPQSPASGEELRQAARLAFPVLVDPGAEVAALYGLAFEVAAGDREPFATAGIEVAASNADGSWRLPTPGTFVIATDGTVRFAGVDGDFRRRTEVTDLLAALDD
jgi:peroxiredoxin